MPQRTGALFALRQGYPVSEQLQANNLTYLTSSAFKKLTTVVTHQYVRDVESPGRPRRLNFPDARLNALQLPLPRGI